MTGRDSITIVGGGISGLAAAWEAVQRDTHVTVLEAGPRWGGLIRTSNILGIAVDEAADAFLARVPHAIALCEQLGLGDQLIEPAASRAQVFTDGVLLDFPHGSVLGVPVDIDDLAATGLLSETGLADVERELAVDHRPLVGDAAIGPFLADRFGAELVDRVVGPLIGGINAGSVEQMSLRAVAPQLADAAGAGGSLIRELQRRRDSAPPAGAVFNGLRGGTGTLIDALVNALQAAGATLRLNSAASSTDLLDGPVLVTTAAHPAAAIVATFSPQTARLLGSIPTASVTLVTLAFPAGAVPHDPSISGFLVPRSAGLMLTAASFGTAKWPHWTDDDHKVVRASTGHRHDRRHESMTDLELVEAISADLRLTAGIDAAPAAARVSRWPQGFHQYDVGHLDLVAQIDEAMRIDTDARMAVCGAAYRGLGIPACIAQAQAAVGRMLGNG